MDDLDHVTFPGKYVTSSFKAVSSLCHIIGKQTLLQWKFMMITFCFSYMQVLRKRPTGTKSDVHRGLSDIAFSSNSNSRLVKVVALVRNT